MAKFEKFDPGKQIRGLADAARQVAREEWERRETVEDVKFDFGHNVKPEGSKRV